MRSARIANFVTLTASGLICMRLRLFLVETEGEHGVLYGHLAKANPQWTEAPSCEALTIPYINRSGPSPVSGRPIQGESLGFEDLISRHFRRDRVAKP